MGIPEHFTYLLRNMYAGQRSKLELDMEQQTGSTLGKEYSQGCILSNCLFNLYAEYIMRNAGLGEAQAGIKFARRSINNLIYADNTTFMAESKEELKSFLMKVKEEGEKADLKFNIQKKKIIHPVPSLHDKYLGKQWEQ